VSTDGNQLAGQVVDAELTYLVLRRTVCRCIDGNRRAFTQPSVSETTAERMNGIAAGWSKTSTVWTAASGRFVAADNEDATVLESQRFWVVTHLGHDTRVTPCADDGLEQFRGLLREWRTRLPVPLSV
jgi:hypothetical protein